MFKKNIDKDPKKGMEEADKTLNKGLSGKLVKGFLGKDFQNQMNAALDQGKDAIAGVEQAQWLAQNGLDAEAEVLSVADTGQTINMNPVVMMQLKVTPSKGDQFDTTGQCMVSRIAVPRVGDKIKIKYHPDNTAQFIVA